MHTVCVTYESCDSSSSSESLSGFPTESAVAPLRNLNATSDKLVLALAFSNCLSTTCLSAMVNDTFVHNARIH